MLSRLSLSLGSGLCRDSLSAGLSAASTGGELPGRQTENISIHSHEGAARASLFMMCRKDLQRRVSDQGRGHPSQRAAYSQSKGKHCEAEGEARRCSTVKSKTAQ